MLKLVFDGDMIVFRACSSAETDIDWGNDLWTLHSDVDQVKAKIDADVESICNRVLDHLNYEGCFEVIMCFSGHENFRKTILPSYKANRAGKRKPVAYSHVVEWVKETYKSLEQSPLEADDLMAMTATDPKNKGSVVLISGDKDMRSIPCLFYDMIHNVFYDIDEKQADYWFYYQTLIGDTADNYKGCPKVGSVGAKKILDEDSSWKAVVATFEKAKLTEEDAIQQAQVARIRRYGEPIDWRPN